jgi:DNA (cytosine-5)-methyltransferase 1
MNSLHLFAGIGGGILADKILGNRIIGAVEINPYCRRVLAQRMDDGLIERFPLFNDIRQFDGHEIKRAVNLICGGFPCQDISSAGKGAGITGQKSGLFYELIRVCRSCRPSYIFLENSPFISRRGLGSVLAALAELGFNAEWATLSARACGAPHRRSRWWCLCYNPDADRHGQLQPARMLKKIGRRLGDLGLEISDAESVGRQTARGKGIRRLSACLCDQPGEAARLGDDSLSRGARNYTDAEISRCGGNGASSGIEQSGAVSMGSRESDFGPGLASDQAANRGWYLADADALGRDPRRGQDGLSAESRLPGPSDSDRALGWWEAEPGMGRVAHGISNRVDRIKGLGNAQVPVCAALAFYLLLRRLAQF